jgi:HAD superfamily hydrolase (TIGR01548 family)
VGYALGHPDVIEWMRIAGEPYAVAGPSLVLAEARFRQDQREVNEFIQRARTERQQLQSKLADYQADVVPSQANFVFVGWHDAEWLRDGLAGMGIAIRIFPGNPALKGRTRITCPGRTDAFERLTHALDTTLAPEGLLFDMDGVLVDVSSSYREAIIQTAAHFGVTVTRDDIARIKAQGNANNDWLVTQRLLAEGGQDISLDDVTNKFEELYQGTPDRPGLRETEAPMATTEQLVAWKQQLPLAVVTGRPRSDAMYLLERFGWTDLFDAVICMEDAPAKPSPEPVQRALDALGITRAWMLGDTPDDIRAARAANVLPLGVIPPGHDDTLGTQLTLVGAGRILSTTSDLQACLNGTAQGTKGTTDDE